jgi:uncharacterized protein (TIGR02266 family)
MGYSSAGEARQARESLGKALQALQQDADVPEEVRGITQNVAKSIGALFEAEYASTEPDGKTCVKNALGTLSQTLALLQDVKSQHAGVQSATESIADVISILFPLTNKPSVRPESSSRRPGSQHHPASRPAASRPLTSAPPSVAPPSQRSPDSPVASNRPPASLAPSIKPSPNRPVSGRPVSGAPAAIPTSMLPPPAPIPTGPRQAVEANLGATTQSNFYVGFSGEIAHGGVFLATYEALPKDTSVRMLVTLPGGFEFECDGYVRFVRDPMDFMSESEPGMGIQFEGLSDEARDLVLRFVHKRPPIFYDV